MGAGWADHSEAGATGRAPPLPVSSTNCPEQLCLRQGEAATLKNKNPKGGTSPAALEDCWAPTPSQGSLGQQPGAGRHSGSQLCCHPGAPWLPCPSGGEAKPGRQPQGLSVPTPQSWGLAEPPLYSPSFWEKIFSKVTSPRSSRYFCMTLRMLRDRGAVVTWGP